MYFKKFLQSKGVVGSLIIILFYGLLMVGVYFSGYKAIPSKINQLPVAIVNQDNASRPLANQLKNKLPFKHIKTNLTFTEAKNQLQDRKVYLIINVPKNFNDDIKDITHSSTATLKFYINYSNPTTVTTTMESASKALGSQIQKSVLLKQGQSILTIAELNQLQKQVTTAIAANPNQRDIILKQATTTKNDATKQIKKTYQNIAKTYDYHIIKVNQVPSGMHHSMAPFFLTLSFYIGSMIAAMLIVTSYKSFSPLIGRWRAYLYTEITIGVLSVFAPLLIIGLSKYMLNFNANIYWQLWLTHSIELFSALNINLVFSLILGQLGIMINMPFMLVQVISGAGMIPQCLLPKFFKIMSYISPSFYTIQSDFNILYGGNHTQILLLKLLTIGLVAVALHLIIVACQKNKSAIIKPA